MKKKLDYNAMFEAAQKKMCPNLPKATYGKDDYPTADISPEAAKALMDQSNPGLYDGIQALVGMTGLEIEHIYAEFKGRRSNVAEVTIALDLGKDMEFVADAGELKETRRSEKTPIFLREGITVASRKSGVWIIVDAGVSKLPIIDNQHIKGPNRVEKALNAIYKTYWAAINPANVPKEVGRKDVGSSRGAKSSAELRL